MHCPSHCCTTFAKLQHLHREEELDLGITRREKEVPLPRLLFLDQLVSFLATVVRNFQLQRYPFPLLDRSPHLPKTLQVMSEDLSLLPGCGVRRLQLDAFRCRRARLRTHNQASLSWFQKLQDPLAGGDLRVPVPDVQEHDDADDVPRAFRLPQGTIW